MNTRLYEKMLFFSNKLRNNTKLRRISIDEFFRSWIRSMCRLFDSSIVFHLVVLVFCGVYQIWAWMPFFFFFFSVQSIGFYFDAYCYSCIYRFFFLPICIMSKRCNDHISPLTVLTIFSISII